MQHLPVIRQLFTFVLPHFDFFLYLRKLFQPPPESMYELLLLFLNSGLTFLPTRIDWLLLRAEVEFHLNRPQAALVTYLEACAVATDSFLHPLPAPIQCEQV